MDPFEAYGLFLALRKHFTDDKYSYIKYNGKVKTSYDKFITRGDRFSFHKLSKKDDPEMYVISNLLVNPDYWITDIVGNDGEENYINWKKRIDSLTRNFETEISRLEGTLLENIEVKNGQHPRLLKLYIRGDISPETILVLDYISGILNYWNNSITDTYIWPEKARVLTKYKDFFTLTPQKKEAFKQKIVDIQLKK